LRKKFDFLKTIKGYTVKKSGGKAGFEVYFDEKLVARAFKKEENNI